jgi:hypothetical protein
MRSSSPQGVTHQPGPSSRVGRRLELSRRLLRLPLPAMLAAMALAACAGSTASPPPTSIPLTAATTSPSPPPIASPAPSQPVTTSASPISLGPGASPGGPCPSADAVSAALSVRASFADAGLLAGNAAAGAFVFFCQYGSSGGTIQIQFYKGMPATAVSPLMKGNPSTTYTSVAGVGDQAETYSVSGIEGIIATKGTTVIQINIYGTTIPLSSVETFTNQLF